MDNGYRHIDGAAFYGNEKELGRILAKRIGKDGLERKDLFITSKVGEKGNTYHQFIIKIWNDKHHPDDVRPACEQSIKDLGVEYLDLYLIHWPFAAKVRPGKDWSLSDKTALEPMDVSIEDTWRVCFFNFLLRNYFTTTLPR